MKQLFLIALAIPFAVATLANGATITVSNSTSFSSTTSGSSNNTCSYFGPFGNCSGSTSSSGNSQSQSSNYFNNGTVANGNNSQSYTYNNSNNNSSSFWGPGYSGNSSSGQASSGDLTIYGWFTLSGPVFQTGGGSFGSNSFSEYANNAFQSVLGGVETNSGNWFEHTIQSIFNDYFYRQYVAGSLTDSSNGSFFQTTESGSSGSYFDQYALNGGSGGTPKVGPASLNSSSSAASGVPEPSTLLMMLIGGALALPRVLRGRRTV